jgi:hypothetical protein
MATPTYTPLANVTLGSAASSVIFNNIPNTYRDLVLIANWAHSGTGGAITLKFNGDTGSNYPNVYMTGTGTGTASAAPTSSGVRAGAANISPATTFSNNFITNIFDYATTNKHKSVLNRYNAPAGVDASTSRWANTAAVTSITVQVEGGQTFVAGATLNLYGVIA